MNQFRQIVNLLNEIGMLAQIPRSGFAFLGTGKQSIAEHSYRVSLVAHALAHLMGDPIDRYKLVMMCLLHDLPESRIGDLNYVQKKYVTPNISKALHDLSNESVLGPEIVNWIEEYEKGESLEAQIAHDADQIEFLLVLKRELELGNQKALEWFQRVRQRIKTKIGIKLVETILETSTDQWWIKNPDDPHWIDGGKKPHMHS
ncbi:HD domain-containing protein [Candidatus Protochlamydia sp. R18]|uniref:HD domain-containing protein n=1 Tax=Candidatus Protochlamydia sp. R18 TaxID=1353977 RepID=UPI0005A8FD79|nr:HD domain-containing protein [Candidatus Protochlamydia sp. R18]